MVKVKFYGVGDWRSLASKVEEIWPPWAPRPSFEEADELYCEEEAPQVVVSEEPVELGDCLHLWSRPDPRSIALKALQLEYSRRREEASRRTLVTGKPALRPLEFPSADGGCLAPVGCDLCVRACPAGALRIDGGRPAVDGPKCADCGLCISACPGGQMGHTTANWRAWANVANFLRASPGEVSISCSEEADLKVPCIGALGPEELALLASASPLKLHCPNEKCPNRPAAEAALKIAEGLAAAAGGSFSGGVLALPRIDFTASGSKRRDYAELAFRMGLKGPASFDPRAYRAVVDPQRCTLCEVCARKCPTRALTIGREGGEAVKLLFNPANCVNCGLCVRLCREGAIKISEERELDWLRPRAEELDRDEVVRCRRCGAPVDNKKRLLKVARTLGASLEDLAYCPPCRQEATASLLLKPLSGRAVGQR